MISHYWWCPQPKYECHTWTCGCTPAIHDARWASSLCGLRYTDVYVIGGRTTINCEECHLLEFQLICERQNEF